MSYEIFGVQEIKATRVSKDRMNKMDKENITATDRMLPYKGKIQIVSLSEVEMIQLQNEEYIAIKTDIGYIIIEIE